MSVLLMKKTQKLIRTSTGVLLRLPNEIAERLHDRKIVKVSYTQTPDSLVITIVDQEST